MPLIVEDVALDFSIPGDKLLFFLFQPHLQLTDQQPFKWASPKKEAQLAAIVAGLQQAKAAAALARQPVFIALPEYSIPGVDGVVQIDQALGAQEFAPGTIVLGGVDGLTKEEYASLAVATQRTTIHASSVPDVVPGDRWVNCSVTWIKGTDGVLSKWIQTKLCPSWPELAGPSQMYTGNSIFVFKGSFHDRTEFRFLSLICYDWIGPIAGSHGISSVLESLNGHWDLARKELHLAVVLQTNPAPSSDDFIRHAADFFQQRTRHQFVDRDKCGILFVNSAGGENPGKHPRYGQSAFVFSESARYSVKSCFPTYAVATKKHRKTEGLVNCTDLLFRESGACIHVGKLRLPSFLDHSVPDRSLPIDQPEVHPYTGNVCARRPRAQVPPEVKWMNDQLDHIPSLLAAEPAHPLKEPLWGVHQALTGKLRACNGRQADELMRLAQAGEIKEEKRLIVMGVKVRIVDYWDDEEERALSTVVHALVVLSAWKELAVGVGKAHATLQDGYNLFDVAVVKGANHAECARHALSAANPQRFLLLISEDLYGTDTGRDRAIWESAGDPAQGPDITNPEAGTVQCGYRALLNVCFAASSLVDLSTRVETFLGR